MRTAGLVALLVAVAAALGLAGYYQGGRSDALEDARYLERYADRLIDQGRTGDALGPGREAMLLKVNASAGIAVNHALAERMAFERYRSGIGGIRAAGYADGLEDRLSQRQIMALWLETVEMGASHEGWMQGFFPTSVRIFGRLPARLTDAEFLRLAAVVLAPRRFHLEGPDSALDRRVARLQRLVAGDCRPRDETDVWLQGCARDPDDD
jgi:monofunctional biosynthetic peptidoglycan transglycosylase